MTAFLRQIQTTYIYHWIIWSILIFFKLIMDYSVFGNFLLLMNLKIFLVSIILFYINYYIALPFLIKQSPKKILIITISFVVIYVSLMIIFMPPFPKHPPFPPKDFNPNGRMMRPFHHDVNLYDIFFRIGIFSMIFSILLFFVDKWMENGKKIKALEFERQSSELKILREQINPHFFFNALNSIYSLSIIQSKDTPRVILILSDIMRYVLNNKNMQKNNLNDEINNIKKYIEIQSIRFNKFNNLNEEFNGNFESYEIEPLLLLTFVENAFKYADLRKGALDIKVHLENGLLDFKIRNFYEKKNHEKSSDSKMGIENTKMKLNLLYPEKYQLNIDDNGSEYKINLKLQLN
ncbi:sensor histidine kinase [Chryseobacterium sp. C39-AII1]|uniref:sensor histidine kinase n=1 Tax=Chryseobacterium sp. C39-AII1 TaxID=3080332 RepID=UPI00320B7653